MQLEIVVAQGNGRPYGTENLHQIFIYNWGRSFWDITKSLQSLSWWCHDLNANLWMVLTFQKWPNFGSGFWIFMFLIDENVDKLCHVIHEDRWCLDWQYLSYFRLIVHYKWVHFNQRHKHEAECFKICAPSAEWWPEMIWLGVCKNVQYQTAKNRNFLSDIFLFQKMKIQLNGQRFQDTVKIRAESQVVLENIVKWKFQETQQWERHWARCVNFTGDYLKGDSTDLWLR